VARVWASDITQELLDTVKAEAAKRGLANLRTTYAKAEALPFEDASFDLVTCRIAPHHFDSIPLFLDEVHRVLKPGALFALADNVVPEGSVGDYVNAFERFRDPSHLRAWTLGEWRAALPEHQLAIVHEEQLDKTMDFKKWAGRHDAVMRAMLLAMLTQATPAVKAVLEPKEVDGEVSFRLSEGLFIAKRV
jgi:ubiquinone/menaquinone biosynthesis C-methylase UbiE